MSARTALAKVGLLGKDAAEHEDEDEDAKASEDEDAKAAAEADDDESDAKAQEEDEDEEDEDDESETSKKDARRLAAKADRKAERKAQRYCAKVANLCELNRTPELAAVFIAKGVSTADVSKALLKLRADASAAGEIAGQTGPDASPSASAAMWDHAIAKNAKAAGLQIPN